MADEERNQWSKVDNALQRREDVRAPLARGGSPLLPASADEVDGVLAKLKAKKIERRAALQAMKEVTTRQLDVLTHQLREAGRVKKAETSVQAEHFLANLDAQYRELLHNLGLRNEAARVETLTKLGDQMARSLKEIQSKDWPDFMFEESTRMIKERYSKFLEKLMADVDATD